MKADYQWDDGLLLLKLKEKDRSVTKAFILEHQDMIFRTCLGFLHNREDAEELTQDVFMEIFNHIGKFKGKCKLRTWIYRICYTRALNKINKYKWQKWMQSLDTILGSSSREYPEDNFESDDAQPDLHRLLRLAIDELPEMQKTAFVLHNYEGLKYQEVAEIMKSSVSSVESLIFRAKQNLKKKLTGSK